MIKRLNGHTKRGASVQFSAEAAKLAKAGNCLWLDPAKTSFGVFSVVQEAVGGGGTKRGENGAAKKHVVEARSPIQIAKAVKVRATWAGLLHFGRKTMKPPRSPMTQLAVDPHRTASEAGPIYSPSLRVCCLCALHSRTLDRQIPRFGRSHVLKRGPTQCCNCAAERGGEGGHGGGAPARRGRALRALCLV